MKRLFKRILWFLGAIVLLIVLLFSSYLIRSRSAIKKMTPVETSQITGDVYAIRNSYVNMYLVSDGDHYIAVDAGINKGDLKTEFKRLDIDPDRVKAVLLTHSDSDHAGGIKLFDKAEIYLPENEEQLINGETGRFLCFGNKLAAKDYKLIKEEIIRIGNVKVKSIPTPGHTPGATCYVINDRYLFTGDAMRLYNGTVDLFPKFINKDARLAKRSMKKLTDLHDVQFIFTAHYGYSNDYKSAVKGWKK